MLFQKLRFGKKVRIFIHLSNLFQCKVYYEEIVLFQKKEEHLDNQKVGTVGEADHKYITLKLIDSL